MAPGWVAPSGHGSRSRPRAGSRRGLGPGLFTPAPRVEGSPAPRVEGSPAPRVEGSRAPRVEGEEAARVEGSVEGRGLAQREGHARRPWQGQGHRAGLGRGRVGKGGGGLEPSYKPFNTSRGFVNRRRLQCHCGDVPRRDRAAPDNALRINLKIVPQPFSFFNSFKHFFRDRCPVEFQYIVTQG